MAGVCFSRRRFLSQELASQRRYAIQDDFCEQNYRVGTEMVFQVNYDSQCSSQLRKPRPRVVAVCISGCVFCGVGGGVPRPSITCGVRCGGGLFVTSPDGGREVSGSQPAAQCDAQDGDRAAELSGTERLHAFVYRVVRRYLGDGASRAERACVSSLESPDDSQ